MGCCERPVGVHDPNSTITREGDMPARGRDCRGAINRHRVAQVDLVGAVRVHRHDLAAAVDPPAREVDPRGGRGRWRGRWTRPRRRLEVPPVRVLAQVLALCVAPERCLLEREFDVSLSLHRTTSADLRPTRAGRHTRFGMMREDRLVAVSPDLARGDPVDGRLRECLGAHGCVRSGRKRRHRWRNDQAPGWSATTKRRPWQRGILAHMKSPDNEARPKVDAGRPVKDAVEASTARDAEGTQTHQANGRARPTSSRRCRPP